MKSREDVETFIGGLKEEDASQFTNADNIMCVALKPNTTATAGEGEDVTEEIITGQSIANNFDNSINKNFAIKGAMYVIVMVAESAVRPAEVATAERKEKVNKKKNNRRTPAKIVAELRAKTNKKLALLKKKRADLDDDAFNASAELEQFASIGSSLGLRTNNPINIVGAINKSNGITAAKNAEYTAALEGLSNEDKAVWKMAMKFKKAGKGKTAGHMIAELHNPALTELFTDGMFVAPIDARQSGLKSTLASLTKKNEQLLVDLALAPNDSTKRSIKSMLSKNSSQIRTLRAKLGTYKNISVTGMRNKAAMLAQVNADIEANIAAGQSLQESLNAAIAKLNAKPEQKQIIKQQVIQQVAAGMPMQYAVQQAVQANVGAPVLSGNSSIQQLVASL